MKKKLYTAAIILFAVLFAVSAFLLIRYYVQIGRSQAAFDDLAQLKDQAQQDAQATESSDQENHGPLMAVVTDPDTGESKLVLAEYAPIYELNPDTVGWIAIDGTNINFPVMHKPEVTDYYLYKDFYGKYSNQGTIYVREQCDVFTPSDNVTIYGHRTNAGTMFAALQDYQRKDFWQDHQYIQFDTLTEKHTYQIFAVFTIESSEDSDFQYHLFVNAEQGEDFDRFVTQCKRYALYETGVSASPGDKLIALSTCVGTGNLGRLVVVAKRITE